MTNKDGGGRWGMYAPGVVGIAVGLLILLIMKDSPESIGYPPIEPKKIPKGEALEYHAMTSNCVSLAIKALLMPAIANQLVACTSVRAYALCIILYKFLLAPT